MFEYENIFELSYVEVAKSMHVKSSSNFLLYFWFAFNLQVNMTIKWRSNYHCLERLQKIVELILANFSKYLQLHSYLDGATFKNGTLIVQHVKSRYLVENIFRRKRLWEDNLWMNFPHSKFCHSLLSWKVLQRVSLRCV